MKPINNDRAKSSRKSRPITSHRLIAGWHKDVQTLLDSVERAWAAAERMRLALEDHDTETRDPEKELLDDVF